MSQKETSLNPDVLGMQCGIVGAAENSPVELEVSADVGARQPNSSAVRRGGPEAIPEKESAGHPEPIRQECGYATTLHLEPGELGIPRNHRIRKTAVGQVQARLADHSFEVQRTLDPCP
ncbi:hypothetical protein LFM09_21940 [Lentzea alba]